MNAKFITRSNALRFAYKACRPTRLCAILYAAAAVAYIDHSLVLTAIYIGLALVHITEGQPKPD
jgi:multisubunit Na+/H+ antiporter MnhC subunit